MAKDLTEFEQQHFVVQQVDEPSMSKSLDRLAMELSVSVAYLSFGDFGTKPEIENKILNFRKGIKGNRPKDLDQLHFRWLKRKEIYAAFSISITQFSKLLKCNPS